MSWEDLKTEKGVKTIKPDNFLNTCILSLNMLF